MTTEQDLLLRRLLRSPHIAYKIPKRMEPISEMEGFEGRLRSFNEKMYFQIGWLFELYPHLGIFTGADFERNDRNSWQLSLHSCLYSNLGDQYMYGERFGDPGDYLFHYLDFGSNFSDGGIGLGICAAPENFGKIACCTFNACSERGDVPIVANSFTEWLERTLDHGPDADCFYWQMPDFVDLGPAIPNDPSYQPIGRLI